MNKNFNGKIHVKSIFNNSIKNKKLNNNIII